MPCWTPRAPQAVRILLTFSFVLYRPPLSEMSGSLGINGSCVCQVTNTHTTAIFTRRGSPASSAVCQHGALFVPPETLEAICPHIPFGRSRVRSLGKAQVWLRHPYPFTRSCVVFSCGSEPRATCQGCRSGACPDRAAGWCPSAVLVSVCTSLSRFEWKSVEKYV